MTPRDAGDSPRCRAKEVRATDDQGLHERDAAGRMSATLDARVFETGHGPKLDRAHSCGRGRCVTLLRHRSLRFSSLGHQRCPRDLGLPDSVGAAECESGE